jgi:hypothetical protein
VKLLCQYEIRFKAAIMLLLFLTLLKPWSNDLMAQNSLSLDFIKRINNWQGAAALMEMDKSPEGFIIAGYIDTTFAEITGCTNNGSKPHGLLIETDTDGNIKWAHCYDSSGVFYFACFSPFGEIWANGFFDTLYGCSILNDSSVGVTIAKLDSLGHPLWYNKYGSSGIEKAIGVSAFTATSDGGALLLESFNSPGGDIPFIYGDNQGFTSDAWLCKLDSVGNIQWSLVLGGSGNQLPESVKELKPGEYTALINTTSTDYMLAGLNYDSINYAPWLVTVDTGGHIISSKVVKNAPNGDPVFSGFSIPNANNIIVVGEETPYAGSNCYPGFGGLDFLVIDADSNYNYQWCALAGGSSDDFIYYTCDINDSLIAVGGQSQSIDDDLSHCSSYSDYYYHAWIAIYNLNQQKKVWEQCFCGSGEDIIRGLIYDTMQNALYVLESSTSPDGDFANYALPNSGNMYLLKYTPITTGIESIEPNSLQFSVFPNPANEYVNISTTGINGALNLKLMDLMGNVIAAYKFQQPEYQVPISGLAAGMYLISVSDNEGRSGVRKFVKE